MVPARTVMKIANTSSADSEDLENNDTADSNKAIKNALRDEARSHFGTRTIGVGFLLEERRLTLGNYWSTTAIRSIGSN